MPFIPALYGVTQPDAVLYGDLKRGVAFRAAETIINTTHWGKSPLAQWTQVFTEPGRVPTFSAAAILGLLFTVHALLSFRMTCPFSRDPVQEVRPDLTKSQCIEVLNQCQNRHDAEIGINLEVIRIHADDLFPEEQPAKRRRAIAAATGGCP